MDKDFPFHRFFRKEESTFKKKDKNNKIEITPLLKSKSSSKKNQELNKVVDKKEFNLNEINALFSEYLKSSVPKNKFDVYFTPPFKVEQISEYDVIFNIKNNFIKTMIEIHYLEQIRRGIKKFVGDNYNPYFSVKEKKEVVTGTPTLYTKQKKVVPSLKSSSSKGPSFTIDFVKSEKDLQNEINSQVINHFEDKHFGLTVDSKKTFENFVVGPSNNLAHASMLAISKNPGTLYPSICLHGNSGLGKTHLLHAVANQVKENHPHLRICLITARDFMTEMVNSIASKQITHFRKKYSEKVDLLMIDDVHELKNKTGTQNEFFHIFNELYNNGKQLIFTTDRAPRDIHGLEERIQTRLTWGLVLDIQRPDFETRIAILKKKAVQEDIYLSDDVVYLIAESCKENIRELEGGLIRLGAFSSVMQIDIDINVAKEQLKLGNQLLPNGKTLEGIAVAISEYYAIPIGDIRSKSRNRRISMARHIAMYLSYYYLDETLSHIGQYFGGRDHSSVLHAIEKVKLAILKDEGLKNTIQDFKKNLKLEEKVKNKS